MAIRLRDFFDRPFGFHFDHHTYPHTDTYETKTEYILKIELPGVRKTDINIAFEGDVLTISGEKKQDSPSGDGVATLRTERFHGKFERSWKFPPKVPSEKITAKHNDGILTVIIPKAEPHIAARRVISAL